jgi:predicted transcriptional regulator
MDLDFALRKAGSQTALAKVLGVTRQAVNQWRSLPRLQVYRLRELRPRWAAEWRRGHK